LKPAARVYRRRYPTYLLEAIDWAMEIDYQKRPQNASELLQALSNNQSEIDTESAVSELFDEQRAIS
ncbi:MAG: serine/threonine protein kinase, partial [Candidatus Thiodiazotropha sp.]